MIGHQFGGTTIEAARGSVTLHETLRSVFSYEADDFARDRAACRMIGPMPN